VPPRSFVAAGLIALAACGGDESPPGPVTHVVDTRNRVSGIGALLVAYEQGGRWWAADEIEDGVFEIAALDRALGVVLICNDPVTSGQDVTFDYLVLGDEPDLQWPCFLPPDTPASFDVIPGNAVVSMRGRTLYPPSNSDRARRTVTAVTVEGSQDLIARTETRVLIRRGVTFPLTEPLLMDVEVEGVPLAITEIAEPDTGVLDLVTYRASLVTANRTVARFESTLRGDQVQVAPRDSDTWRGVEATATTIDAMRPHLVLPSEELAADVAWGGRPDFHWVGALGGEVTIVIEPDSESPAPRWIMSGSPEWLIAVGSEGTGAWRAPDMGGVRGWRDAWNTDVRGDASWWISSERARSAGDVQVVEQNEASGYAP
jgi:hypothetical protein